MFESSEARTLRQHFKKCESSNQQYGGLNRRTVGLLPDPQEQESASLPVNSLANRNRLLVTLEAEQQTCCLKIASDRRKSRAAALIFRGRVLGTVYGSKVYQQQLFDHSAYANFCTDLIDPDSTIDAYRLDEELTIAAAALFHGQPFEINQQISAEEAFKNYVQVLMQTNMPGCVVLSHCQQLAVCLAYVFGGKLVGFYSAQEGWQPPVLSAAVNQILKYPEASVSASMLTARNIGEVFDLTFSLSGLADRCTQSWSGLSNHLEHGFRVSRVDSSKLKPNNQAVQPDRFIPSRMKGSGGQANRYSGNGQYSTNP